MIISANTLCKALLLPSEEYLELVSQCSYFGLDLRELRVKCAG